MTGVFGRLALGIPGYSASTPTPTPTPTPTALTYQSIAVTRSGVPVTYGD